jgi:hypothetical protein
VLSGSSSSAASRGFQAATCRSRLRAASGIKLHKWHSAASVITACAAHPGCPSLLAQQRPSVRVVGFSQAHRPSVPRSSVPLRLTHGPSVSHRAAISFAPSESVPRGSQTVSPLDSQKAHRPSVPQAVSFSPSESDPSGSQAVVTSYPVLLVGCPRPALVGHTEPDCRSRPARPAS